MFNPSFCQELSNQQPARRHPNFPSGTHDILVGEINNLPADTPISRQGHTTSSSGTNGVLVGDKRGPRGGQTRGSWGTNDNRLSVSLLKRRLVKKDRRH